MDHFKRTSAEKLERKEDFPHLLPLKEGGEGNIPHFQISHHQLHQLKYKMSTACASVLHVELFHHHIGGNDEEKTQVRSISLSSFASRSYNS